MNLDEFAVLLGFNQGTLGRLERGDTCISIDTAKWMTKRLIENGIIVTAEWILTGKGETPQRIKEEEFSLKNVISNLLDGQKANENIKNSIPGLLSVLVTKLMTELNQNVISTYVKDNKFFPIYEKGEFVIGLPTTNIEEFNGKFCIVSKKIPSATGIQIKIVRKVIVSGEDENKIILAIPSGIINDPTEECKVIDLENYEIAPIFCKYSDFKSNIVGYQLSEEDLKVIENNFGILNNYY